MTNLGNTRTNMLSLQGITQLADYNQWIVWKLQSRRNKRGELKQAKVPFNPRTQRTATNSLIDHCTSFEAAYAASSSYNGIGFVFTADDPFTGIDLDGCRDPETGRIARWAWRWIMRLDSYSEISPSGTGVKIFVRGIVPESIKAEFGEHVGIEVYTERRYFCVTGQHLRSTPRDIRDAQEGLTYLYLVLARLQRLRRFIQQPRFVSKSRTTPAPRTSPAEAGANRLSARETIDRANSQHDLGDLLVAHGATLVATRGAVRYYDGLHGDTHDNNTTYIVSPSRDGNGYIGHSYSPNGKLSNVDHPRGFRWFDAIATLEHGGNLVAALKAVSPRPTRATALLPSHPTAPPEYLTVANAEQRQQWREMKRQQRVVLQRELRERTERLSALATTDARLGQRERDAWAVHHTFFASQGRHCVSVAAQAARLCAVDHAEENHVRRMQRANERLITCGYLQRTDRRDGSNTQTSWWEPGEVDAHRVTQAVELHLNATNAVSEPSVDDYRVTVAPDTERVTLDSALVTLHEHSMCSMILHGACELGGEAALAAFSPDNAVNACEASFDPTIAIGAKGSYTGRTKHSLSLEELMVASSEHWRSIQKVELIEESIDASPEVPLLVIPVKRAVPDHSALDHYHARIALLEEVKLAGELRKHQATLRKYAGEHWLNQVRQKIRCVEQELDLRDAARATARPAPNSHAPVPAWLQSEIATDP